MTPASTTDTSLVCVHNEWDPLEEMIVGRVEGARIPSPDLGLYAVDYSDDVPSAAHIPSGPYSDRVIGETQEDLEALVDLLTANNVSVRRPDVIDHARPFASPDWQADGEFAYCPRDVLLTVGTTVIETPMVNRTRYFETFAYRRILHDYFDSGANWISAPKPQLRDDTYAVHPADGQILRDHEPIFDAANVLRLGRDLLYLVSRSGNERGLRWLRRVLGGQYRVHAVRGVYDGTHLDTTFALIRPGLVVVNPERVRPDQVPDVFSNWEVLWSPPPVDTGWSGSFPRASLWQSMNLIMINPELAVVSDVQLELARELERRGVSVAPARLRHARTLSGGFHCVTTDVRRAGVLADHR